MAARRRHERMAPGVVVAAADSRDRLTGTAAEMLEAQKISPEKTWAERSSLRRRSRVIPPHVAAGGGIKLACLAPLVALR